LLERKKVSAAPQRKLPGLGVSIRLVVLVHQRHRLQWDCAKKLERQNGRMPILQNLQKIVEGLTAPFPDLLFAGFNRLTFRF
jgi:hypothetical protein